MNRNILKWVLIAAVVLGAAAYLILSETPSKKKAPRPKGQKEQIVIKEGHSKAFKIEPIEGITISAAENALDKDREFKITPVAEKSRKKMEKELAAVSFEQPLFAFDMNSGQTEEELFPGVFTCQIDLKKMGIPENLYDYIRIWRYDGEQLTKYTSWVQNGKLVFRSDHNGGWMPTLAIPSAKAVAMTAGTALLIAGAGFYLYHTWVKHSATGDLYKNFFMSNDDAAMYPVWDSYGNFEIHFRFKDTEWADKHDEYVYYNEASYKRLLELYEQAQKDYRNHKTIESLSKTKLLPQLFKDEKDCEQSKEVITLSSILVDLCEKDSLYQEYNKKKMPPPSIVEIGEFLKLSNRYLTDNQHLKPQSINLEVNLVDGKHITGDAEYRHPGIKNAYMLVNFDHMWTNGREKYVREGMAENVLIDINHELFHHREKIMKWMDLRTEETMAAYNEYHAAKYFFEKHETTSETPRSPSDRTHYEYYGRNFNKNSTDAEVGYVYADFMDSLQIYTGRGSAFVRADSLIGRYGYFSSHKSNYMKWFNIKDEKTFDDYLKRFCMNSFPKIAKEQAKPEIVQAGELGAQSIIVSKSSPMAKVTTAKESLIMRDVEVDFDIKHRKDDGKFNAFVIRDKDATEDVLAFCWCKSDFSDLHTKDSYMHSETGEGGYRLGYFKHLSGKYKFTIVALFAPDAPDITKVKDDHISFILTKPSRDLTKNKLVTGAVVTYTDKNGNTQTLDVNPKQFGKRVKWPVANASKKGNAFTLTAHWYYKPDDQTTYVSPESKMAEWGGHLDEQEKPQAEEKAPETNYWKLVNVRMEKTNTSYKESQNPDEEVDADYRSIYFAVDRTEKSCTFMGIAATEEVHEDNTRHYVRDLYLDGTLTFTEPPKFWTPGRQYKAICEVADDPYLLKISEPFVFEAENSSSQPTVCLQSKNDKIDKGWSSLGETNWLRSASTTFEAHSPEKDSPKFFTLTQSYSIAERPYSDLMAKVVLHYDYEWVGEPEEETTEEEPEGSGCWRLVKVVERDENNNISSSNYQLYVTGSKGQFTVNSIAKDVFDTESYKQVSYNVSRSFAMEQPKKAYYPRDIVKLSVECSAESGGGHDPNTYCQVAFLKSKEFTDPNNPRLVHGYAHDFIGYSDYGPITTSYKYEYSLPEPSSPTFFDKFCIMESAAGRRGTLYYYEWVEGEPEDITVERMDFVAYLPESPVAKHIDCWPRQIFYGHDQITTYKEGSGYRVVGVSDMKYGTFFDEDARVTYQDRMEITLDKDFNVIRGTFTWDLSYYSKDPYVVNAELGKYDNKLHLQFEKTPDDGKTHKYHYRIVSLDASTRVTTPKDEQFYVLTTGDLQYNWVESDGKDHYDEYGCTPNCTPMDCWEMAKIVSDKDHNVEIDLTIKKQKH